MTRQPVEFYLKQQYPFNVIADDGEYVLVFPDLPGCMTQVEDLRDIGEAAEEARTIWIETAYDQGLTIPLPSHSDEFSGKFNVRIPRSLHQQIVQTARREGCSLNQYVTFLLSTGNAQHEAAVQLREMRNELARFQSQIQGNFSGVPQIQEEAYSFSFTSGDVFVNDVLAL